MFSRRSREYTAQITILRKEAFGSLFLKQMQTVFPKAHNAMMSLHLLFHQTDAPRNSLPVVLSAKQTWPDISLMQPLPIGSCRFPGKNEGSSALGTNFINGQILAELHQCKSLGQTSGPSTQHKNRECYPGGKLQLTKDKCSYAGS